MSYNGLFFSLKGVKNDIFLYRANFGLLGKKIENGLTLFLSFGMITQYLDWLHINFQLDIPIFLGVMSKNVKNRFFKKGAFLAHLLRKLRISPRKT